MTGPSLIDPAVPDDVARVVWDLPCVSCGVKTAAAGCDGLCDDCWIEAGVLELICTGAVDDDPPG